MTSVEDIEDLKTRVIRLEAGQGPTPDTSAAVLAQTRRDVRDIKATMVTRIDIERLLRRFDSLAADSAATRGALKRFEESQRKLTAEVRALQTDVRGTKIDLSELKVDVSTLHRDVAAVREAVLRLEGGQARLESDVSALTSDVAVLKSDVSELKGGQAEILALVTQLVEASAN